MKHSLAMGVLALTACKASAPTSSTPNSGAPFVLRPEGGSPQPPPRAISAVSAPAIVPVAPGPEQLTAKPLALPGATPPVSVDYIVYDRGHARVWVPVGDTGSVDVLDVASGAFSRIDGFKTSEREVRGRKRMMGPSAAAVGEGVVYVGNRASNEVCPVDSSTLKVGNCLKLSSPTDGVAYVASAKEVWVTTPHDQSLTVLDASTPATMKHKTTIQLDGAPEGYAVDDSRGLFFTNLEDKNLTIAIDVKTHKPTGSPWKPDCGPDGPRGIAADISRGFVYVACTDHVQVLDASNGGIPLGKLYTGAGVDNIDWLETHRLLYIGAARAAKITIARVDDRGQPTVVATGTSAEGSRNPVADASGNAYVVDP
ncbi:MAG: hypothetical protein M3O46_11320, partial [Myxococcota bacterium]|nr:hypothetical protein [Myxococcota bacterium]